MAVPLGQVPDFKELPLVARKGIRDSAAQRANLYSRINAALGEQYEIEVDYVGIHKSVSESDKDQIGPVFAADDGYIGALASSLEALCKDDMNKETFVEKTPARKIIFRYEDVSSGTEYVIENGALVGRIGRFNLWMSYFRDFNFEALL